VEWSVYKGSSTTRDVRSQEGEGNGTLRNT